MPPLLRAMMETGRHLKPIRGLSGTSSEPVAVRKDAPTRISFRSDTPIIKAQT